MAATRALLAAALTAATIAAALPTLAQTAPSNPAAAPPRRAIPPMTTPPQSNMPPVTRTIQPEGQEAVPYVHPTRGFVVPVPPGTQAEERGESFFHMQARKGWVLSVQSGAAKPDVPLKEMLAKLEARNLGEDKRWRTKLEQRPTTVAGLPAIEAVYEGATIRAKAIIVRGRNTDHVLIFLAPPDRFEDLVPDFTWILANFRPGPEEGPPAGAEQPLSTKPNAAHASPAPRKAPKPTVAETPPQAQAAPAAAEAAMKRFAEARFGYSIEYPNDWVATPEGAYAMVFSGPPGSPAYRSTVSIQNVQPPAAKSPSDAATAVLADIKRALAKTAKDLKFEAETPLFREDQSGRLSGRQFLVSYDYLGERFRKWAVVMPRRSGNVAYIWSYTAPFNRFDQFRPLAEKMLDSWNIDAQ